MSMCVGAPVGIVGDSVGYAVGLPVGNTVGVAVGGVGLGAIVGAPVHILALSSGTGRAADLQLAVAKGFASNALHF